MIQLSWPEIILLAVGLWWPWSLSAVAVLAGLAWAVRRWLGWVFASLAAVLGSLLAIALLALLVD